MTIHLAIMKQITIFVKGMPIDCFWNKRQLLPFFIQIQSHRGFPGSQMLLLIPS